MLGRKYRLNGRVVHAMMRKRKVIHGRYYSLWYFSQQSRKEHHQFSFHVAKKFHKSAVMRHQVKRVILSQAMNNFLPQKALDGAYYKFFLKINMKRMDDWHQLLVKNEKKDMLNHMCQWFSSDWRLFSQQLGKRQRQQRRK